jgi:hypothetical protein
MSNHGFSFLRLRGQLPSHAAGAGAVFAVMAVAACGGSHARDVAGDGAAPSLDGSPAVGDARDAGDAEAGGPAIAANVRVDTTTTRAIVGPFGFGLHASVYDNALHDSRVAGLLREAGVALLRWPGGGYADNYHWSTHTLTPWFGNPAMAGYLGPGTDFGGFVSVLEGAGVAAMITVNYGSNAGGDGPGEPQEAAAWVAYANADPTSTVVIGVDSTGKDWGIAGQWAALRASSPIAMDDGQNFLRIAHPAPVGIRYWEVGNEVFGNGYYTAAAAPGGDGGVTAVGYEEDLHVPYDGTVRSGNAQLSGSAYGAGVVAYAAAMKAVDPTIRVGALLNTPPADYRWGPTWNMEVLQAAGPIVDFVVVHWYTSRSAASLLRAPRTTLPAMTAELHNLITTYCGGHAADVDIAMTEVGPNFTVPAAQAQAEGLFAADTYVSLLEDGLVSVDWLELHNGTFLSEASEDRGPAFYGIQLAHQLAAPGDALLASTSDQAPIVAHASRRADGTIGVMLINTQPVTTTEVTVTIGGTAITGAAARYDYAPVDGGASGIVAGPTAADGIGNPFTVTLTPYTATDFMLSPKP